MPRLPPLEAGERVLFFSGTRDFDKRMRPSPLGCLAGRPMPFGLPCDSLRPSPRRRNARRFARLLAIVRRPRRIPEAVALVTRGELQQLSDRARPAVHVGVRIAALR